MNTREKKGTAERRVIVDLSHPKGRSVNDAIPKDKYLGEPISVRFPSTDDLVDQVVSFGIGCQMYKIDLKKAYGQIPVDQGEINMLGYVWDGKLYCDTAPPKGLRSSAYICQETTNAVRFIME